MAEKAPEAPPATDGLWYLNNVESRLKRGDHLTQLYETKQEQLQMALPFLAMGLDKGERCICATHENTPAEVEAGLSALGVDVDRCLRTGQLQLSTAGELYTSTGSFDPYEVLRLSISAVNGVAEAGYPGMRIVGDVTWILADLAKLDSFMVLEALWDNAVRGLPFKGVCQYDAKRFPGSAIVKVLRTHPRVLLGQQLFENSFYQPLAR